MKKRFYILHKFLEFSTIHRRSYAILEPDLPPRHEFVLDCRLTPMQKSMYEYYIDNYVFSNILGELSAKKNLFLHFCMLGFIWNHPALLLNYFAQSKNKLMKANSKKQLEFEFDDESDGKTKKPALQSVSTIMETWDKKSLPNLEDVFELELRYVKLILIINVTVVLFIVPNFPFCLGLFPNAKKSVTRFVCSPKVS